MNKELIKGIIEVVGKVVPEIIADLTEKRCPIENLTITELVKMFFSHPNNPQCFMTTTALSCEQVLALCREHFTGLKMRLGEAITKDGWNVLIAEREKGFVLFYDGELEKQAQRFEISVRATQQTTQVIIACRFTEGDKIDVFKIFKKNVLKKINRVAVLVQADSQLQDLSRYK